jgi:hypothetical protein
VLTLIDGYLLAGSSGRSNRRLAVFEKEIDPSNNEVIAGTTQVSEIIKIYTIPFSKDKVDQISTCFEVRTFFCIVNRNGEIFL